MKKGSLPDRATKHIRRPQLAAGTVNRKGKMKVVNARGNARYVDAKKGLSVTNEGTITARNTRPGKGK